MYVSKAINAEHKDLIHDVSYDFYGQRMATCSSDQFVKIWDLDSDGQWKCTASWRAHSGSVWRVTWAHPEFGQVIATCSFDRTAIVWEEQAGDQRQGSNWLKRGNLVDSRTSVTDVKFAPKHIGLQLATCSANGNLRIYEAPDIMNLTQWSLQNDISCKISASCLSWNPSRAHTPMIAVGSDDSRNTVGGKVHIYECSDPNDTSRKWVKVETISTVTDPVRDVAFAPNLGRSYHILAVASKELVVYTLKPISRSDLPVGAQAGGSRFEIHQVALFNDHNSQVWRLGWNVTGTILSSSGDDGCVRLWKANYLDNWKCIAVLKGDISSPQVLISNMSEESETRAIDAASNVAVASGSRYYNLAPLNNAKEVVWH